MGYDNKGAWTDLINGVDYVDAKDINNLAHKEQELEAIVKEKAYKKGERVLLSNENDIIFDEDNSNPYLNFDKSEIYHAPNTIIGKDNFTNKKSGFDSANIVFTLLAGNMILGNSNAFMEDMYNSVFLGYNNALMPRNTVNIESCTFTHIGNKKYKITGNVLIPIIERKKHLFAFVKNSFNSFSDITTTFSEVSLSYTSDEHDSIIVDLGQYGDNIRKEDVLLCMASIYHNDLNIIKNMLICGEDNVGFTSGSRLFGNKNVGFARGTAVGNRLFVDCNECFYIGRDNDFVINNPQKNALIVGWGTPKVKRNVFRVDTEGGVFAQKEYSSTGADYAEYFEWKDGNLENEDRTGYFVTLNGDKIKIAESGDWILGVISAQPSVIGDSYDDDWHNKYITDEWGRILYDEVIVPADGDMEEHTEMQPRVNPNYDITKKYIPRSKRKEWAAVGMMGKLYVKDNRKCKVNSFCTIGNGGIAVPAENGYRVMKRISDNIIQILLK